MKPETKATVIGLDTVLVAVGIALMALGIVLHGCTASYTKPVGGKDYGVSVTDCQPLQAQWVTAEVTEVFGWHIAPDDQADWEVHCDTGIEPLAGRYDLGARRVRFNPTRVHDGFGGRAVVGHELVHLLLAHGPHPETAVLHVCDWAYNESPPPGCFPRARAPVGTALMSTMGGMEWDGTSENLMPGAIAEYRLTDPDLQLIAWGLRP